MTKLPDFKTPMMQQYAIIKSKYKDCLLFFRLGDFYEFFMEDAKIASEILDITLTSRDRGKDGRIPMAGVPYHAADNYISKLVKAGYKVAICEQLTAPVAGELVEREVVRTVTPGTLLDTKALDRKQNNYLAAVDFTKDKLYLAFCDVSTGDFQVGEFLHSGNTVLVLQDLFSKFNPVECILNDENYNNTAFLKSLLGFKNLSIFPFKDWPQNNRRSNDYLCAHFKLASLEVFGVTKSNGLLNVCSALLKYIKYTQNNELDHINKLQFISQNNFMALGNSTIFNLELFSTIRSSAKNGTLLSVLDKTSTAMGGRLLKQWILHPLVSEKEIQKRHLLVETFLQDLKKTTLVRKELEKINDIERLLSRLVSGIGNARDLVSIKQSLYATLRAKEILLSFSSNSYIKEIIKSFNADIANVAKIIEESILDDPSYDLKGGGIIKKGYSPELDSLRNKINQSVQWLADLEVREKDKTKIPTLKVGYNKVFGYYIEISKSYVSQVPERYVRKQTLVNGERYITQRLKEEEDVVLAAEEKINALEHELFTEVLKRILTLVKELQACCQKIAEIDCIVCFTQVSFENNYARASVSHNGNLQITEGRHPVVENIMEGDFVPNDTSLSHNDSQIMILTGPNMAGKSVYMRQVALIVLMNQIGCFVPAKAAQLPIVDKIFVRSGASDFITSGLSTFMVEMVEAAYILNNATPKSLIVLDELGRGTSTYDGVSIAQAIVEHLATSKKVSAKTLFATHYHELQELENVFPRVKNYQLLVSRNKTNDLIFTHKVALGASSHSYGIDVAKVAGISFDIVTRAKEILVGFESTKQVGTSFGEKDALSQKLRDIDVNNITPLQALALLSNFKAQV